MEQLLNPKSWMLQQSQFHIQGPQCPWLVSSTDMFKGQRSWVLKSMVDGKAIQLQTKLASGCLHHLPSTQAP